MKHDDNIIIWTEQGFCFEGVHRELSENAILLTSDIPIGFARPHVYDNIHDAFGSVEVASATLGHPVTVYIAPDVYWIDDPAATDKVQKKDGYDVPFGMYITCEALNIVGLSDDPRDIVIAGNRGQSHASNGNYTMLHLRVQELSVSNITIGNYCCVDLEYPLDPAKNYPKRTEAITQAQLAGHDGKKLYAKNCRFVSRLNLCPICGAERALYEDCHFECADDSLNGGAVHINCDFELYGNRPIYQTFGTGTVFIDCLFRSRIKSGPESRQYFTKEGGPIALINCRFETDDNVKLGWTKYPDASLKCYQYNVTQNGKPVILGGENAAETVLLDGKQALDAYIFEQDGKICANLENLLGDSQRIPTMLKLTADRTELVSDESSVVLTAQSFLFSNKPCGEKVSFSLGNGGEAFAVLREAGDNACVLEGCNSGAEAETVIVTARTERGLESAVAVFVKPCVIAAPCLVNAPRITKAENTATLEYELSPSVRRDVSEISWYRCDSGKGDGAVLCGVSKLENPQRTYRFTEADAGMHLKAVIRPKLAGSLVGNAIEVMMAEPVGERDIGIDRLFTDFSDTPDENLPVNQKGCWICDCAKPEDIIENSDTFGNWGNYGDVPAWKYGLTGNGSEGVGLYQNVQGARLRYEPVHRHCGDMSMTVKADPAKTAGQGFGSAGQYMDLGIKFDTEKLSGYALRVIRRKDASDAVAMALVEYKNGKSRYLTELQLTSCFLTGCTLNIALNGNVLTATAFCETPQPSHKIGKYKHEVKLEAEVEGNQHDGILIWHTGSTGSGGWQNTTMLHSVEVNYK